jgi:hypothetical protein
MQRFEIEITQRRATYYFTLYDRVKKTYYVGNKSYNSRGSAREAATLMADAISAEFNEETYEYGPEI